MPPKVKIVFRLTILIISIIISIAFYVDYKNLISVRRFGQKEKAIILEKIDDYDIEPKFKMPTKYGTPPRGKHINFHFVIRPIIPLPEKEEESKDTVVQVRLVFLSEIQENQNKIDLFIEHKQDWKELQIFDTIDIYTDLNHNNFYFADDVTRPPFWDKYYFLITLIGLALAIIVYRKL